MVEAEVYNQQQMRRLAILMLVALPALGRDAAEYRAFWVDTFNSPFAGRGDVARIVDAALASNANAVFVQVRRRGDAWYLDAKEPLPEIKGFGEPDQDGRPTYDPLRALIEEAHKHRVEVHAFVIVGAVWRGDRPPRDPEHVFLRHVWDPATNKPYRDDRQWATATNQGTRKFNNDWYLDLGHPEAAAYTVDVLTHLVEKYELDGIHLDRIRYPESPGANVGYNAVSLRRFHARYGGSGKPKPGDRQWSQWRREQVTNFLRRLYISVKAVRPEVRVSAAVICYGPGPRASGGFANTDAYSYVFQDWKSWSEEGLLDLLAPMDYKREHRKKEAAQFDDWSRFTAAVARDAGRISIIGIGSYLNTTRGTLAQIRRATGSGADGVLFFSMAAASRSSDFFDAVRSRLFPVRVPTPESTAHDGHVMGQAREGATIRIEGPVRRTAVADGSGFWGAVHLPPGPYRATADGTTTCFTITAGLVSTATTCQ
jgi:uncharacterized lipoprotein YddW (UPF0748 family)